MAVGSTLSVGLLGLHAFMIQSQAFVSSGLPYFSIIGLPDASLAEARERVRSACQAAGIAWPQGRVTVNLSPASVPKHGSSHDLAIAASVLAACRAIPAAPLHNTVVLGELNLDGSVLPVQGVLPILLYAKRQGCATVVLPRGNMDEAALVPDLHAVPVDHVGELVERLGGQTSNEWKALRRLDLATSPRPAGPAPAPGDMSEVMGQEQAKRAMAIAAAGGHHMLMVGPPGTGKTMLAQRMPSIMCPLTEAQQLEVASIRSLCGNLASYGISDVPPFEAPHHTATAVALVGGGSGVAQPGLVTKAHHGVLFLDEATEFAPRALQTLREPLESGHITLSRSKTTTTFPARFQLVMASNPCPCGYGYGSGERCTCRERDRIRYFSHLSGPILDRIDIQIDVLPVQDLHAARQSGATSSQLREQVVRARRKAQRRFREQQWTCNAQASGQWLREHTPSAALNVMDQALSVHMVSLRGAHRAMRISWTLADLDGAGAPSADHVRQALMLRTKVS